MQQLVAGRNDLTDEEWEALHRLDRGQPEAGLVPQTMRDLLVGYGLAAKRRGGAVGVSEAGKRLIHKHRVET
ncbi:hypothetical protein [Antarcticirhabdus aurantiaca]|uniref:Uncharacterized protein n=1 Tax=Antarcticirhabdus aurantiaca TaxID=2606717 RepID=A0ACD4NKX4_9HYPH|nr:hypothetical protein [Antarcticirhabdus aurantiaca]WAJ27461.1 hypothetical protein OXU80_21850 [Jeongeuplla avenae]